MTNIQLPKNPRIVLSTLWVFVMMNMIYADILGTLKPGYVESLQELSTTLSPEVILLFSVLMEVPIIMIPISRFVTRKWNRIFNYAFSSLSILWVVVPALMTSLGSTPISYVFFAIVECSSMIFIMVYAARWKQENEAALA